MGFTLNLTGTLLSGTISSFSMISAPGGNFLLSLGGPDIKNPDLLTALGLAADTQFACFGFVAMVNPVNGGTGFDTNSVDLNNTVAEPGTLLLLGTGLIGLAGAVRRRVKK